MRARDGNEAVVRLDDRLYNAEPQPETGGGPAASAPVMTLPDKFMLFWCNTDAVVPYADSCIPVVF